MVAAVSLRIASQGASILKPPVRQGRAFSFEPKALRMTCRAAISVVLHGSKAPLVCSVMQMCKRPAAFAGRNALLRSRGPRAFLSGISDMTGRSGHGGLRPPAPGERFHKCTSWPPRPSGRTALTPPCPHACIPFPVFPVTIRLTPEGLFPYTAAK